MTILTGMFWNWFKKKIPPISAIEQQVLNAGGTWWESQIFQGNLDWDKLFQIPATALTVDEQNFLEQKVTGLCDLLDEWQISYQDHDLTSQAWEYIKTEKFWGLGVDREYGGLGFSAIAQSAIISKIAAKSISAAITVMVPNSLGPAEFLKSFGTAEQKTYYLPRLARGEETPCFALTGIEAGSDASSIRDSGVVCLGEYQGQEVLGVRLNWNKRYITLASISTLIGLAFRLYDPDHLLGTINDIGITLALIPANLPGVDRGPRHFPLNMGFRNGPIRGVNVFIPLDYLIGGVERRGQGWQMMMECLALGRGISLPSLACAMTQWCLRASTAYGMVRYQFHRPIGEFEGVAAKIAHIAGLTYLCEATRLFTIEAVHQGAKPAIASAISKYHLTEFARQVVNDTMDIFGGHGIQMGPKNYLGFLYNAAPICVAVEGANLITRNLIIYGQGVLRCHPYLRHEINAVSNGNKKEFGLLLRRHLGFILSHAARLIIYGVTGGCFIKGPKSRFLKPYCQQLTRMSNSLIILTEVALAILGKNLKMREALSARLGDILSYIYMSCAVIKYYQHQGQGDEEAILVEWTLKFALSQIEKAILEFLLNFPKRGLAFFLRRFIFPWGRPYVAPSDDLNNRVAQLLQQESALRVRLTSVCEGSSNTALQQTEAAMQSLLAVKPLLGKIKLKRDKNQQIPDVTESYLAEQFRHAYQEKMITLGEYEQLQGAEQLYWSALQADEFLKLG